MRRLYARPALRPMQDIDLLVPADRLEAAGERLLAGGLRRRAPTARRAGGAILLRARLPAGRRDRGAAPGLPAASRHPRRLRGGVGAPRRPARTWAGRRRGLGDVDAVAYHALALAKDEFTVPLIRLVDLRLMLAAGPGLLRPARRARARVEGGARALRRAVPAALGCSPTSPAARSRPSSASCRGRWRGAGSRAACSLLAAEQGRAGAVTRRRQLWRKFWLLDGARRRAAFAAAHAADSARGWWRSRGR